MKRKPYLKVRRRTVRYALGQASLGVASLITGLFLRELPIILLGCLVLVLATAFYFAEKSSQTGWPKFEGWPHIEVDSVSGEHTLVDAEGTRTAMIPESS